MMKNSVKKLLKQRDDMLLLGGPVLLLSSVFFFFGPLQLYLGNITELWFSFWDVFWPSLITFFIVSCILMGLGVLLYRWKKLFYGYNALLCGLGIALYIQGNFLPFSYGGLTGSKIIWELYKSEMRTSAIVWMVCLVIPFAISRLLTIGKKIITFISLGMVVVQLIALMGLAIITDFSYAATSSFFLSNKGLFELSDQENIVIFILDAYDESFLEEVYSQEPEFLNFLDGFTWFTNAVSVYPNTRGSLPYLLTGQFYENDQTYDNYVKDAWKKSADYYQTLCDHEFEINIYTERSEMVSEDAKLLWLNNSVEALPKVSNPIGFEGAILRLTGMRYFPDFFKKLVWIYDYNIFGQFKVLDSKEVSPYLDKEVQFYQQLKDNQLSLGQEKKYHVIHLDGTHAPYTVMEDLSEDESKASAVTEARGSLTVVKEYIEQLKKLNIYDQTYIIITADHGTATNYPILLVKPFDSTGKLEINRNPVSHTNLRESIMEPIGETGYGDSLFNLSGLINTTRRCFKYIMDGKVETKEYFPDMEEYYAVGYGDKTLFYPSGRIFTEEGIKAYSLERTKCQLDQTISLDNRGMERFTYFSFDGYGAETDEDYLWSTGHYALAHFDMDVTNADLICHIQLGAVFNLAQRIIIKSQGTILYENVVTSSMPYINFPIPKTCIQEGQLLLDFEFPDACSFVDLGISEDPRILSIGIQEILFTKQEKTEEVSFTAEGNASKHVCGGWYSAEQSGCWTNGNSSVLAILPEGKNSQMQVTYLSNPASGDTKVYCNDKYIGMLPKHTGFSQETVILPVEYLSDLGGQKISFVTDGVTTYLGKGGMDGTDTRPVGIYISNVGFEVSNRESERKISFERGGDSQKYLYNGWYEQEEIARWAGETAELIISFPEEMNQQMKLDYLTNPAAGDTEVYYNNHYVGTLPHHSGFKQETIILPAEYKNLSGEQIIKFNTDDATTYLGTGGIDGTDLRTVSIYISEIEFEPVRR